MIPSVLAKQFRQGVEDFLKTTFPVSTPFFHGIIDRLLAEQEGVFKGPFLSIQLPFRIGWSQTEYFPDIPLGFTPYLHQEKAFQRLSGARPKSTIVATGTGSGKTESFLYPILDHCYRHRGEPGIKAILIYPMNALATDQAGRIAKIVCKAEKLKDNITAGLFIGQMETDPKMGMSENHIISHKDTIRNSPPDILLTNYKMLDYLLIRSKDYPLWRNNTPETLRYLVVDELHTFDGAQGTDLACLLRRLKERLKTPKDHLCCAGTSATLGSDAEQERLKAYAEEIFGEPFNDSCIISESRLSAGEFLEKSLISNVSVIGREHAADLDPENFSNCQEYISIQHKLWFGEELSSEDFARGDWRFELPERLKGQLFFQNLLKVLGGRIRSYDDILDDLQRVTPELRGAPRNYGVDLLNSLLALVSSAALGNGEKRSPFLHVRHHLWLRELRRMVSEVNPHPRLRFADDLNDEQLERHLPIAHCRECNSMGWAGLKRQYDPAVMTDLQSFYAAFFKNDPKVVFIFPEEDDGSKVQAEGLSYRFCSACLKLTTQLDAKACPHCNRPEMMRVFIPNTRVQRRSRQIGTHDCPYCNAHNGMTILGSRAASLTSVLIAQLYASTFNDDRKLLTFSDSVQDAAHRAGFFQGRTYRFSFRTALQRFLLDEGDGLSLGELPEEFARFWSQKLGPNAFVATFLAPNMEWFGDYDELKKTGKIPEGSKLLDDVKKRIGWEILSEYGFRSRIGRTLEKSGSSVACSDGDLLDKVISDALLRLRNEIGGLEGLDERTLRVLILGLLSRLKQQGAVWHPVLCGYVEHWGNIFLLNRIPWMAGFGMNARAPAFLTSRRGNRFELLFGGGSGRLTWYEAWAAKCFTPVIPLVGELIRPIYSTVLKGLVQSGVLFEKRQEGDFVWGVLPEALRISKSVVQLKCGKCGHEHSVASDEEKYWEQASCLRFNCRGAYRKGAEALDYYGKLYASGEVERIFAEEHTGLLDRDKRENLEERFKSKERQPWDPNLLSCTPTLEMGIDIGDLSSVILCSVPPAQANYLQRIGRAGRRDGNAVNVAVANARPHDLFFFAEPESMIEGEVDPPGVFLNASAVLERQFTAFCMDRWVESGIGENALPAQLRQVLGNIGSDDPGKFPYNFLKFIETYRTELFDRFVAVFSDSLTEDSVQHLRYFVEGNRDIQGSLSFRIVEGLFLLHKERESLRSKAKSLGNKVKKKQEDPAKGKNYQIEMDELIREKKALQSLVTRINDRHTLNFMTDEGLLPNYAFPEAGVILRSIIYRRKAKVRESEGRYDTLTLDYERPAVSAISELAPANSFFAGGRRVRVDQIDVTVSDIEAWRFCNNCAYHVLVGKMPETVNCPHCGSAMWSDAGQKRQMLRMRQVFATTSDRESRISDESDDRDPCFYNKQILVTHQEADVTDAYAIENDELPFGFEFLRKVNLREINFGEKEDIGEKVTIAGVESPRKGFVICRHCGKIQDQHRNEIKHTLWCPSRKKDSEANLSECVYLYREFSSEAVRILLPLITMDQSENKLHSFIAALHLGLKLTFGGNIDHLQTTVHQEPVPDSNHRKEYLVLYDTVPGGTGYLKQLMRSEKPLMEVFAKALATIKSCKCIQDATKDGCYQCLYAYRRSYSMGGTSRETAAQMLSEILKHKEQLKRTGSLKNVQVNSLFDSELEARFIEALRRVRINDVPAKLKKDVVNGKPGYIYRLADKVYTIEPQRQLGEADGVHFPSVADFLIRPAKVRHDIKPVAVFTDGFFFHKKRVGLDMAQRHAITASGNFHVWSLSWKDVENAYKSQGNYFHNHLNFAAPEVASKYKKLLDHCGVENIIELNSRTSFDWLIEFLKNPDAHKWAMHGFVHCLLRLDNKKFAAESAKGGWLEKLQHYLPGQVADVVSELGDGLLYGLVERDSHPEFMRLFVAASQDAVQQGEIQGMLASACLMDGPENRESAEFEAAWNGYLRLYNLMQFLPNALFATQEGKASGYPYHLPLKTVAPAAEPTLKAEWGEIKELVESDLHELIGLLAKHDLPIPEVGFELAGGTGEIIAESELAWPNLNIALLTKKQGGYRGSFTGSGWKPFMISEVVENSTPFISLFR
ncbi:DEAD/DEAH box helicase [Desulfoferrobacter suflitae]|uniref:DEAD/DEAH box helicase n=1 Tax=Desulfoferrobacter suflitae TaxID=2865782 RepID=UPI002164277E|nr:DEAD/DEAH box helicase [Desulfoferrobacter suflitae]MCK8601856.1 DEAD/DEAH box helicase [Desulfoferrobacter suflitae]